ncbi:O-antigen ligase family protein [Algibacter mikhailovii]|uniref:O-antigen ligase-related domain-containing protein n=1 Tax=Algibacter mikhailovii TaxID=425498 RepID=A0A918R7T4_9FLAO|nr:O-antigen ligase family protein [Algibacter mikhailovii]GGZ89234.1 hypothetical protein GCM10007028_29330 [Algibacter mikhailovii]
MKLVKSSIIQIDFLIFCASIATLSLSIKLSSKLLFIALSLGIIKSIINRDFKWILAQKKLLVIYIFFFIYICIQGVFIDGLNSFFLSFDRSYAPYLVFLLAPVFYFDSNRIKVLPKIFIAGLFFTFLLILINSILHFEVYDRSIVQELFDIHHLYMSLYILFSINYLLVRLFRIEDKKEFVLILIMLVILVSFLGFFKSKAAMIILILLLAYHTMNRIKWNAIKKVIILSLLFILIVFFKNFLLDLYLRAFDFRLRIWSAATEMISQNIIFGYGSLNEYLQLNIAHFLHGNYEFLDFNYNAHNQYLSFLLKFGLIGLLLILMSFGIPFFKNIKLLKKEYIGFLIIVGLMCFIESIYNRHHGIVLCTLMLYYYNTINMNEIKE